VRVIEGFQGAAFGLADGVICTLGLMVGVAVATWDLKMIIVATVAGGTANALGNSVGFYLSELTERSAQIHEISEGKNRSAHTMREVLMSGIFSFVATAFVLALLLTPFFLTPMTTALLVSCAEATFVLFLLGFYVGKLSGESPVGMGLRYVLLGSAGAIVSYIVGDVLRLWLTGL